MEQRDLAKDEHESLTDEQRTQYKLRLVQNKSSEAQPPKEDRALSPRKTSLSPRLRMEQSASTIEDESSHKKESSGAFAKLGRSLSLGRSIGRKTQQSMEDAEKRKSPRGSPRPSSRRDEIESQQSRFMLTLEAATKQATIREGGIFSENAFGQLLKKALDCDMLHKLIEWSDAHCSIIGVESYRLLVDALIDQGGVDFTDLGIATGAEKRNTLSALFAKISGKDAKEARAYFEQVLSLVCMYSMKRAAAALTVFPAVNDYGELAQLINAAVRTYRTGLEMSLCATLWREVSEGKGNARAELCETLVQILIEAHEGKLQGAPLKSLKQLVARQKTFKDAHVLGAFCLNFGGKIESELVDKLIVLARGIDAKGKKDISCMKLLEDWAFTTESELILTRFSFDQIAGDQSSSAGQIVQPLSSFDEIDRTKTLTQSSNSNNAPVKPSPTVAPKKAGSSLKDAIQNAKDTKDEEDTWAKALRALGGAEAPAEAKKLPGKHGMLGAAQAKAQALLHKNQKTDKHYVSGGSTFEVDDAEVLEKLGPIHDEDRCPICREWLDKTQVKGKSTRPRCNHECSMCWICKKPLEATDAVRVNLRNECQHKIHKSCCPKIEPHVTSCFCGLCGTLIQAHGAFRAAIKSYEASRSRGVSEIDDESSIQSMATVDESIAADHSEEMVTSSRLIVSAHDQLMADEESEFTSVTFDVTEEISPEDDPINEGPETIVLSNSNLTSLGRSATQVVSSRKALPTPPPKRRTADEVLVARGSHDEPTHSTLHRGRGAQPELAQPPIGRGRGTGKQMGRVVKKAAFDDNDEK